ncbi:MAG: hypothetical protein DSY83_10715 [Flavobacteriia bacterium]|uniref:hypothetical protein n=1 Tax=Flagellimonas sp. TaxID=2058762 RepID=UPI001002CA54|nr:MAG: hypothetical protein DSY83_10715 [Flavobacteriia bacterium]
MKLVKLFSLAMLCMAIVLVSCSGEDGERGPTGQNGTNGVDGVDGNANVQSTKINMEAWNGGEFFEFDMPIPGQNRPNYAFLFYLEYLYDGQFLARHSVPGAAIASTFTADVNYVVTADEGGIITFKDLQGADFAVPPGFYFNLIIISIEISNMQGKNGTTDIMSELKSKGVDTDDYNAVAAYFGLD